MVVTGVVDRECEHMARVESARHDAGGEHTILQLRPGPGMPPEAPMPMPVQHLRHCSPQDLGPVPLRVAIARAVTFGGASLLVAIAAWRMAQTVSADGLTVVEVAMTGLFALTFGWMSLAATSAIAGLIVREPRRARAAPAGADLRTRTALIMPTFHEDPWRTTASLASMAKGLQAVGAADAFEIVILSDSSDARFSVAEAVAAEKLGATLRGVLPVWYRRRRDNSGKKAGNIKDFIERWGGRYEHVVVLDADSLMTPETLVRLAASMEADPRLGILQTVPQLVGGRTFFARLQQFATCLYGPVVARGVAAWQGGDGNFWGHNAIVRTRAFAACCGLPRLPGARPLGGAILSHDFVEAALMRRGGWTVEMTPQLGGSWEESPPSLIDAAVRDRRWAQGNLQHSKVIGARGLAGVSRVHLAMGIMSYMVSPLWLALIGLGLTHDIQARYAAPARAASDLSLEHARQGDPDRIVQLFALTLFVLLLPKLIGVVRALALPEVRRGCGGPLRLTASFLVELVASALLAPIMMAFHSRQICEILAGRDAGWTSQRRHGGKTTWRAAWSRHRWHTGLGAALAAAAGFLSPAALIWLSPIALGLILSAPLSRASGSVRLGQTLRRLGLLATPEELHPQPILTARDAIVGSLSSPGSASRRVDAAALPVVQPRRVELHAGPAELRPPAA